MADASTTAVERFTPIWLCDAAGKAKADAPVFLLRAGDVIERAMFEAELSAPPYRAGRVWGYELRASIRDGINSLMAGDAERERLLDLVDGDEADQSDDDKHLLAGVRDLLGKHWQPYATLLSQLERRREIAPILALRHFCVGIEAKGVTFALDREGLVSTATLATVDPIEMMSAGNRAYAKLLPDEGALGNLPPPSASEKDPKISSSDGGSTAAGSSKAPAGKKTPGSRSRPGRSSSSISG